MLEKDKIALRDASPYNAAITREQFLFYEVRTTAKLVCEGLNNDEVVDRIVKENLFIRWRMIHRFQQLYEECILSLGQI